MTGEAALDRRELSPYDGEQPNGIHADILNRPHETWQAKSRAVALLSHRREAGC